MKMWSNGREYRIPKRAVLKTSHPGTYKGQRGAWHSVHVKGKRVGITFAAGPVFEAAAKKITIISDIEPFRNIAVDYNEIIGGRRQKREMMQRTGLVEAGDVKPGDIKPPPYDAKAHQASMVDSLKETLHHAGMGD
jgi:hypothetical protein